jgi:membrane-bound serine protease (ClpP class)
MTNWIWIPILIVAGVTLIWFEIFVPGMVLASAGTLCLVASVVVGYKTLGAAGGTALLIFEVLGLIAAANRWVTWFPKTTWGRKIVLHNTTGEPPTVENRDSLLQQTGVVVTICRPSGVAEFANRRYDVISEGGFLSPGQAVKVIAIEGNKIVIRAV